MELSTHTKYLPKFVPSCQVGYLLPGAPSKILVVRLPKSRAKGTCIAQSFQYFITSSTSRSFLNSESVGHLTASVFSCSRSEILTPPLRMARSQVVSVWHDRQGQSKVKQNILCFQNTIILSCQHFPCTAFPCACKPILIMAKIPHPPYTCIDVSHPLHSTPHHHLIPPCILILPLPFLLTLPLSSHSTCILLMAILLTPATPRVLSMSTSVQCTWQNWC